MIVGEKVLTYHAGDITFLAEGTAFFPQCRGDPQSVDLDHV